MADPECRLCKKTFADRRLLDPHYRADHTGEVNLAISVARERKIDLGADAWGTAIGLIQDGTLPVDLVRKGSAGIF